MMQDEVTQRAVRDEAEQQKLASVFAEKRNKSETDNR
jgi:hypothetical protein